MVSLSKRMPWGHAPVWLAATLAVLMLVTSGAVYRTLTSRVQGGTITAVRLPIPLKEMPATVDGWKGEDLEIPATTIVYMQQNFADDFVSRRYLNAARSLWADVYVVYCSSKPGGILGHQPLVCYPNNGWIHDSTETSEITASSGRPINCLVHRFHKPAPSYQQMVVLSFYVLNGQITLSEDKFSGPWGRRPNISGDPARYVAQIQISSILEHSVRTAAAQMADIILAFLPDQEGRVKAIELGREFTSTGRAADNSR
jgi:hypothetical protein